MFIHILRYEEIPVWRRRRVVEQGGRNVSRSLSSFIHLSVALHRTTGWDGLFAPKSLLFGNYRQAIKGLGNTNSGLFIDLLIFIWNASGASTVGDLSNRTHTGS